MRDADIAGVGIPTAGLTERGNIDLRHPKALSQWRWRDELPLKCQPCNALVDTPIGILQIRHFPVNYAA